MSIIAIIIIVMMRHMINMLGKVLERKRTPLTSLKRMHEAERRGGAHLKRQYDGQQDQKDFFHVRVHVARYRKCAVVRDTAQLTFQLLYPPPQDFRDQNVYT